MEQNNQTRKTKNLTSSEIKQRVKQKKGWYFITFIQDLPGNLPYRFTLYNEPFMLFRNKDKKLVCYAIPLADDTKITNSICFKSYPVIEKQGMIWFWRGKNEEADRNLIDTMTRCYNSEEENEEILDHE